MRNIPVTMATQHPDNANKPFWHLRPFISTAAEINECYLCFSDLGIDEYNWDWEGKFVDEAVVDRLLHKHFGYFKKNPLGEKKFLTFRIPNPRVEKQFRLARAFMVVVTGAQLAQSLGFSQPPIFETILPLTETAQEVIDIQEAFKELIGIEHRLLKMEDSVKSIEIIPLFEQVNKIIDSADILRKYIGLYRQMFKKKLEYLRPYCARSDPALNSGLVPTILALKVALSSYLDLEEETGVKFFPMLGTGSLPFRGGLSPERVGIVLNEYAGVSTLTLQSAFRYDYKLTEVKKAIQILHEKLPKTRAQKLTAKHIGYIKKCIPGFETAYQDSVEKISPLINKISAQVAKRRERLQHIGLFGYSRGVGRVKLPRAIPFTASLYSIGVPPELIGTGRGIRQAIKDGIWEKISRYYLHLKDDMVAAGYFLNRQTLINLAKRQSAWYEIIEDIDIIEKELQISLGPATPSHLEHSQISQKIYERLNNNKDVTQLITYGGILRKSLG